MDINLSKAQYSEMYKEASKGTKWWVTIPKAFFIWRTYMRYWAIAYEYVSLLRAFKGQRLHVGINNFDIFIGSSHRSWLV